VVSSKAPVDRPGRGMLESLSRLGMELGPYVQQVTAELLLRVVQPGSLSEMERGIREAMLKLGHLLLTS